MLEEEPLKIYVDASVSPDNHGGVGAAVISIDANGFEVITEIQVAGFNYVNSCQMEILACVNVLDEIASQQLDYRKKQIIIYTDSKHVAENYKFAMFHWVGNNWQDNGRPVSDANEWNQLVKRLRKYNRDGVFVEIHWVKGHSKNIYNNLAHKLALRASRIQASAYSKNSILSAFRPQQIKAPKKLEIGSVKMVGQRVSIKILGIEYLRVHKLWSCKYQVVTARSPYYGSVDKAFLRTSVDVGKSYYVKLNSSSGNPRIEKIYWEIQ